MENQILKESLITYMRGPSRLLESTSDDISFTPSQSREYEVGDVIQVDRYYSPSSKSWVDGHFIYVVTHKKKDDGVISYKGFAMSSRIEKSNKNSRYQHNIHVENDDTMYQSKRMHKGKSVFVRVDDLITFTNKDLPTSGVWKGHVTDEFKEFIDKAYQNYRLGKDNSKVYWER